MTCIASYFIVFSRSCSSQSLQGSVFLSLCLSSYSLSMSDPRDRLLAHKYKQKQDRKEREQREKQKQKHVVQKQKHGHHQVLTRRQARKPKKTRQLQSEE